MSPLRKLSKSAARSAAALVCALTAVGCASSNHSHLLQQEDERLLPVPRERSDGAARRGPAQPVAPEAYASSFPMAARCEREARRLLAVSRDEAWTALKSCVEGTRFTQLEPLLSDAWLRELLVRPEGARLVAQVVAWRGGNVEGELRLLHAHKVPIFGLPAAISQPDTYKGRYVLLRAQVADVRTDGDRPTFWLVEKRLGSEASAQEVARSSRTGSLSRRSGRWDGMPGSTVSSSEQELGSTTGQRFDNVSSDTGREALGRLAQPDPFFVSGKDFLVLARFDGMRATSGGGDEEEAPSLPVLSIVSYFIPHPLAVY